jgi:hypothetical protein
VLGWWSGGYRSETLSERNAGLVQRRACYITIDFQTILNEGNPSASDARAKLAVAASSGMKKRGASCESWEDRVLAKQVLADDPILNKADPGEYRWG